MADFGAGGLREPPIPDLSKEIQIPASGLITAIDNRKLAMVAKLAGAPEEVPYFTQVTEVDDNYTSLSAGIDILMRENWILSFAYDRQMADRWDSDSIFAKLMFTL